MAKGLTRSLVLWMLLAVAGVAFVSCDDEIATGSDMQPVFSVDTLHLGTLLAGNSSPTYQLKLYNQCSKELKLTSINLRNAGRSGFRMNVDGMNGSSFTQSDLLRISAGDSLFIFVEATFLSDGAGMKQHIDYVDIACNGKTSTIVLEATSKNVRKLKAVTLKSDETWSSAEEVQIYDSLVVAKGVTLTLSDSVTIYLHDKADLIVYGKILSRGTKARPVTIRGDRTDNMFDNLPYDNLPSQWGNLYLRKGSGQNIFENTNIHGMSEGIFVEGESSFESCRIKNSDGNLITAHNGTMELINCELSNAAGSLLDLTGGSYDIVHCTLANYNFASVITQEAVRLCNQDTLAKKEAPLERCNFLNTIIWGRKYAVDVRLDYISPASGDSIFSYRFDHCLIKAEGEDDENFIATQWNLDPLYQSIEDASYRYDFHLQKESPAIGAGAAEGAAKAPYDIDGTQRSSTPTIGCYETK